MRSTRVEQVMGMPVSVLVRGPLPHTAVDRVYAELHEVDARFSPYRLDSEVCRLRRGEVPRPSDDLREVAALCELARTQTGGVFDARRPDGWWDPTGLVKGWAVERAARHLRATGLDFCLNAGGDVVVSAPSGEPFRVGVQDPYDAGRVARVLPVVSGGVATSGLAARGAHLYDPRTGLPATGPASTTVVGPSLQQADVLATACFVSGSLALLEGFPTYEGLEVALV